MVRVLWCTEEHRGDAVRRLIQFGADPEAVAIMTWGGVDPIPRIRAHAKRLRPELIVIDTLAAIAEHKAPESGSSAQWAQIMRPLRRIAEDTNAALLILHHDKKDGSKYRDSNEIGAAVDVIAQMSGPATGSTRKIAYHGRYGRGSLSVRLVGNRYELTDERNSSDLEREILNYVLENPRCTKSAVRSSVVGRDKEVIAAIDGLIGEGKPLVNRGDGRGYQLEVREQYREQLETDCSGCSALTEQGFSNSSGPGCSAVPPLRGGQGTPSRERSDTAKEDIIF